MRRALFLAISIALALPLAGCPLVDPPDRSGGERGDDPSAARLAEFAGEPCVEADPSWLDIEPGETVGVVTVRSCKDSLVVIEAITLSDHTDEGLRLVADALPPIPSAQGSWPLSVRAPAERPAPLFGSVVIWVAGRETPLSIQVGAY